MIHSWKSPRLYATFQIEQQLSNFGFRSQLECPVPQGIGNWNVVQKKVPRNWVTLHGIASCTTFAVNLYPTFFVRPFGSFVPSQVDGGIKHRQKSQRGPFWNPWRVSGLVLKSGVTEKPGWCGGGKCFLSFSHNMHICWNLFMSVVTYEQWHNLLSSHLPGLPHWSVGRAAKIPWQHFACS